jgi:hypothetical protein
MLQTTLIEDLNHLACPAAQDRYANDPSRAREALNRLRFVDTSELDRYRREGALTEHEADLIERFTSFAESRLAPVPAQVDPIAFTHGHSGWQSVRERALELVRALDAFTDLGVAGWGPRR